MLVPKGLLMKDISEQSLGYMGWLALQPSQKCPMKGYFSTEMSALDSKTWTPEPDLQRRALWEGALCFTLSPELGSRMDSQAGSDPFNNLWLMMVSNAQ